MRYIHRVGRTARQGKEGKALTLLLDQEESLLCSDFGQGAVNGRFTYIYIYVYIHTIYNVFIYVFEEACRGFHRSFFAVQVVL